MMNPKASDDIGSAPTTVLDDCQLRRPTTADGASLWQLVRDSGVLDLNSSYAYLLLTTHFAQTSVVAERGEAVVGFATAYRRPDQNECLFVWQVAVAPEARRCGLAAAMLDWLVDQPEAEDIRFVQATVAPSNIPSRTLFGRFAERHATIVRESQGFGQQDFPSCQQHEDEPLLTIGPLK